MNPLQFIWTIQGSFPDAVKVYSEGGCWEFHKILRMVFPAAIPFYDGNHVTTLIEGKFYDITGEVSEWSPKVFSLEDQQGLRADEWKYTCPRVADQREED